MWEVRSEGFLKGVDRESDGLDWDGAAAEEGSGTDCVDWSREGFDMFHSYSGTSWWK
jgi:hypothetical protein